MDISTLINPDQLAERVTQLGTQISADFRGRDLTVVAVLHGALVFAADLMRAIDIPLTLDIIMANSYIGTESRGHIEPLVGPRGQVAGRDLLIVDDILDTGLTMTTLRTHFMATGARQVSTCVLLDKPARRIHPFVADYVGFDIDDVFVVGYGLDLNGQYRNLPYVGTVTAADSPTGENIVTPTFENHVRRIVQCSLQAAPEEMLEQALAICIELSGAHGGSILGEEGPLLQFLYSDVPTLIGKTVPWDSIAGVTASRSVMIYTYAPTDKRHFVGVDLELARETQYLLSLPIASLNRRNEGTGRVESTGVLQLLFDENVLPELDLTTGPQEFGLDVLRDHPLYDRSLKQVFWILPNISLGMEVLKLRRTSYQAIHELKNKLISVHSWINCLKEDLAERDPAIITDKDIAEDLELATAAATDGSNLAKSYLQFTKIYSPHFEEASLNNVLETTAAALRALVSAQAPAGVNIKVTVDTDTRIPARQLDPAQLQMAFFNLGKNAAEVMMDTNATDGRLSLTSTLTPDGIVEITVADNGPGMPPEIADQLFVPFRTKKAGGTGLGLVITQKIIQVHGGIVQCATGENGTTFTVRL